MEDLLRREPVAHRRDRLRELVAGKTVLVTGAGGSIGSELARQVFDLDPARLVLLDRAEGPLYDIERELTLLRGSRLWVAVARRSPPGGARRPAGQCGQPAEAMRRIISRGPPGPGAPRRRIQARADDGAPSGRRRLHEHRRDARDAATRRSRPTSSGSSWCRTDKAVEPTSVMGATKRLAELAVAAAARAGRTPVTSSVRFGNVLGSSGSVVPLFQRQLARGRAR